MASRSLSRLILLSAVLLVAIGICRPVLSAQGPVPDAPKPATEAALPSIDASSPITAGPIVAIAPAVENAEHRFWDTRNRALFAASAAMSAADFAVTRSNLQHGGQELNPTVRVFGRSTAGLAVNFAGEAAGVIGLSYLLHRTGHHQLERMLPAVNVGASAGAVAYGLTH